jgi:cell division protein ZapA
MANKAVELCVAGQTCRVVTTADASELELLAAMVEKKLETILAPGRPVTTQAMLLAAVALAHDVQEERNKRTAVTRKAKQSLNQILERVDSVLERSEVVIEEHSKKRRSSKKNDEGRDDGRE